MYKLFLIAFLSCCCTTQSQELLGNVYDTYNNPVPYCNVDILNSGKGTYADSLGHFKLFDVKTEDVVVFSSIGYEPIKRVFKSQDFGMPQNIRLQPKAVQLNEVIINRKYINKGRWKVLNKMNNSKFSYGLFEGTKLVLPSKNIFFDKINGLRFRLRAISDSDIILRPVIAKVNNYEESYLLKEYAKKFDIRKRKKVDILGNSYTVIEFEFDEEIIIPKEGLAIGIEVVDIPGNLNYEDGIIIDCGGEGIPATEIITKTNFVQKSGYMLKPEGIIEHNLYVELKVPK